MALYPKPEEMQGQRMSAYENQATTMNSTTVDTRHETGGVQQMPGSNQETRDAPKIGNLRSRSLQETVLINPNNGQSKVTSHGYNAWKNWGKTS